MNDAQIIQQVITKFDWGIFWTVLSATGGIIGIVYAFFRNLKTDINQRFESFERKFEFLENRIFQLAMGKSLKEIMLEEKEKDE